MLERANAAHLGVLLINLGPALYAQSLPRLCHLVSPEACAPKCLQQPYCGSPCSPGQEPDATGDDTGMQERAHQHAWQSSRPSIPGKRSGQCWSSKLWRPASPRQVPPGVSVDPSSPAQSLAVTVWLRMQALPANVTYGCEASMRALTRSMPEDWAYEEGIRQQCAEAVEAFCPTTPAGLGQVNHCLRWVMPLTKACCSGMPCICQPFEVGDPACGSQEPPA